MAIICMLLKNECNAEYKYILLLLNILLEY